MSCSPDSAITVLIDKPYKLRDAEVALPFENTRETIHLLVESMDSMLGFTGTYDHLLDFASALVTAVYNYPLTNGHTDWFNDRVPVTGNEGTTDDSE